MRTRLAAAVALAALAIAPLLLLSGGEENEDGAGEPGPSARAPRAGLAWEDTRVIRVDELPGDRILAGRLVNGSLRTARLDVERVRVVDADGRAVRSTVRFVSHFAHGVYSPESINRYGKPGEAERRRLGEIATLRPRESVPITLSWRIPAGGAAPVAVDFGGSVLKLPRS